MCRLLPVVVLTCCAPWLLAADSLPPPLETKPEPTATPVPEGKPAIKPLGGGRYVLNDITFNEDTRAVTFPAKVNMVQGLLEYAIVHEAGKAHESFLTTTISPYDLNVVLLLLNYAPSATFFDYADKKAGAIVVKNPKIETKAKVRVVLEWKPADAPLASVALESLILNIEKKAPATPGPFTYTGSFLMEDGTFMAKDTGSILALYADAAALLNNPRAGNENDDIWITDPKKTPAPGTAVTVTLSPAAE